MTRAKSTYLALLAVLLSPIAANADLIVLGNGDITGLQVDGQTYDVVWNWGTDPVAGDFDLFDGDQAFASLFMDAVRSAFVDSGFAGVSGQFYYGVDFASLRAELLLDNGAWERTSFAHNPWSCCSNAGWGAVTYVPEPGTLALLGLGLVGMAATRRRRKV